jgi:hypothetical protein
MNNVFSRHRLRPRPNPACALSPPRSPQHSNPLALADLDAFVPSIDSKTLPTWSRESWLVYMNRGTVSSRKPKSRNDAYAGNADSSTFYKALRY